MPSILSIIADNPDLSKALRELIEDELSSLPLSSEGFSDERLGQLARARIDGLAAIERAFKQIEKHRTNVNKPKPAYRPG
jgi:hypothetical protein